MKLNLGCGDIPLKDFVNIDVYEGPCVDLVCNVLKLPYEDNSIEEIYAGHIIEHFPIEEAREALKEWLRVLKPLGIIGIVVPDKDNALDCFTYAGNPKNNKNYKYKNHNSYWNLKMLLEEAEKAGFEDGEKMNIDTYPHLAARPKWQVGITALKGGGKMKEKIEKNEEEKVETPSEEEIEKHRKLNETWCKNEKKFVYNPTKKKHCPFCKRLL